MYNLFENLQYCGDYVAEFSNLLLYTHIPAATITLLIGFFVFSQQRDKLLARLLLGISLVFALWVISNLAIWFFYDRSGLLMFAWAPIEALSLTIFALCFYFTYLFLFKKDLPPFAKGLIVLILAPAFLLGPTDFFLSNYNIQECIATENVSYLNYINLLKVLFSAALVLSVLIRLPKLNSSGRKEALLLGLGLIVFLLSFWGTGYLSSITDDFRYEAYGLFGMVLFVSILTYLIVRYKTFDIKLIAANALVIGLVVLIGSQFTFIQNPINQILNGVTLFFAIVLGSLLVRNVRREIELREKTERLAKDLEETNKRQETLLHFVGHEVKGFLTKDQGAFASLVEGDFGPLTDNMKQFVERALAQTRDGVYSVTAILKASNQKRGTVTYTKAPFDLAELARSAAERARAMAEGKGLTLTFTANEADAPFTVNGDKAEIGDHVLRNLIENSINYTPTGSVAITLAKKQGKVIFSVKDTGVGITDEDKARLFTEGGHGKDSQKVNAHSTGYGLFIAKNIVDAHGGTIRAESEGAGKGSTFTVEFPV